MCVCVCVCVFENNNKLINLLIYSMSKILKCATTNDTVTMRAVDNPDTIEFMFDTPGKDVQAQYEMKLINMDQEHLGIPVIYFLNLFMFSITYVIFIYYNK